jgi:hypothetical protein
MTENLPVLFPEKAIENIKKDYPEEAQIFLSFIKHNVVSLGTDEVFTLRDADGDIKAYRLQITLTERDGHLIQPVPQGSFVVSAQGYEYWSERVGACVIMPPDVFVDGKSQPNPYIVRDSDNRRILCVYARAVAFRHSPMGIPMVSDWTTIFDNPSYRLIDLLAKAKKTPQAFRLLPAGQEPKGDEKSTWARYPFDESTMLWVNTSHEEALTWYSQIINREKKSIDYAQTFAKRNALKHLSGLQKSPTGNVWKITVTAWRATSGIIKWDSTQYAHVQKVVQGLTAGDRKEFGKIEYISGTERVEENDVAEQPEPEEAFEVTVNEVIPKTEDPVALAGATAGDLVGAGKTKKGVDTEKKPRAKKQMEMAVLSPDDQKTMKNLAVATTEFPKEYGLALKEMNLSSFDGTVEQARLIIKKISEIVDREA